MVNLNTNREQFIKLYKPVEQQISNYCRALTGDEIMACDLLQDTLLAAFENFSNLRKKESFVYFLIGIARRIYLKQIRRNKFRAEGKIDPELHINKDINGDMGIDIKFLYKAIAKLPVEQREAVVMFEIMGFSLNEIQKHQGSSLSGVKSRIARARQKLTEMLANSKEQETINTKKLIV
jgi:RNA polymerase sigma-70 factor (ECF subfamily)